MILSAWHFEYALQLQSTKTICFPLCETSSAFIDAFLLFQNIFSSVRACSSSSNIFSETAWPIKAKLHVEPPWEG